MPSRPDGGPRELRLRYPATCSACGLALSPGTSALYDRSSKRATCLACAPNELPIPVGVAGASALAEGTRRKEKRVADVRRRHGDHAAAVAEQMVAVDPSITAWEKGGSGESRLAAYIEREVGDSAIALHDRLIPGTKSNIDHLYVASTGIWVVDAKAYAGRVVRRNVGPLWRLENKVYVGGRDRTKLAAGLMKQVDAVLAALRPDPEARGVEVNAALCFLESEWGLLDFPFQVGQVWVLYPGALRKRLKKTGLFPRERMEAIARRLDLSLPPAA